MAIKLDKSKLVRNLVLNNKLVQHLDKAIDQGEFEWDAKFSPKHGDDGWHPSGHCTPSAYELYHMVTDDGERKPIPGSLMKTFQVGHFWHAYIQWIIEKRLYFCKPEEIEIRGYKGWGEEVKPRYFGTENHTKAVHKPYHYATGMADIAPCRLPDGDYLVDIKTMGSHDYKQQNLPAWCAGKYECQVNIYMDWFDLENAIILCVSKDSPHGFKEFHFQRNQDLIDAIYSKWKLVGECIDKGVEPDEDYIQILPLQGPTS